MKVVQKKFSLRGLRTFCVAARHRSFRIAAEELCVTASAVSHQVKNLEHELGLGLFARESRTLKLTEAGARLYQELRPAMERIDDIVADVQSSAGTRQLRVSVQPFFASEAFVPRLEEFTALHPGIEISVDTSDETAERHPDSADVSIRLFRHAPANLHSDVLFPLRLIPACSKGFLERFCAADGTIERPFPMLVHSSRPEAWNQWSKASRVNLAPASSVIRLDSMIAVARAAERGVGAALVPVPLSENWFKYGALVPLFEQVVTMQEQFYLVYPRQNAQVPEVLALREWVLNTFHNL